jgi:hypothetical protein
MDAPVCGNARRIQATHRAGVALTLDWGLSLRKPVLEALSGGRRHSSGTGGNERVGGDAAGRHQRQLQAQSRYDSGGAGRVKCYRKGTTGAAGATRTWEGRNRLPGKATGTGQRKRQESYGHRRGDTVRGKGCRNRPPEASGAVLTQQGRNGGTRRVAGKATGPVGGSDRPRRRWLRCLPTTSRGSPAKALGAAVNCRGGSGESGSPSTGTGTRGTGTRGTGTCAARRRAPPGKGARPVLRGKGAGRGPSSPTPQTVRGESGPRPTRP